MTDYEFRDDWFSVHVPMFQRHILSLAGKPCRLLEIGTHEGRCAAWLADNILTHPDSHLDTIDPFLQPTVVNNIEKTGRSKQITLHADTSRSVLRRLPLSAYDFIYVDGSHATFDVIQDAIAAFQLAKIGGIIAFDDYEWDDPPWNAFGVPKPAIDAFLEIFARPSRYAPKVEILEMGWQVWTRKAADETIQYFP